MIRLLVVDDDLQMQAAVEAALRRKGFAVETASSGMEAAQKLEHLEVAAVFTDLRMPGMDGLELLEHIRRTKSELPVVVLSAFGTVPTAVDAIKAGATDFLLKPFSHDELDKVLSRLATPKSRATGGGPEIITENAEMNKLLQHAAHVARTKATILVQAESGTGKELLARWIHRNSAQASGPFVAVNCFF